MCTCVIKYSTELSKNLLAQHFKVQKPEEELEARFVNMAQLTQCPSYVGALSPRSAFGGAASVRSAAPLSSKSAFTGILFRAPLKRTCCQRAQEIRSAVRAACRQDAEAERPAVLKRVVTGAAAAALSVAMLTGGKRACAAAFYH